MSIFEIAYNAMYHCSIKLFLVIVPQAWNLCLIAVRYLPSCDDKSYRFY